MTKISAKGIASAALLIFGILQLSGGVLMLVRFKIAKPQTFILGIVFLILAVALHKGSKSPRKSKNTKGDLLLPLKCPKCGRTFDRTWKVCLQCSELLIENTSEQNKEEIKKIRDVSFRDT